MVAAVALDPEAVGAYLDQAIRVWRRVRDEGPLDNRAMASHYLEVYQSVRINLLGDALPSSLAVTQPSGAVWPAVRES